MLEISCRMKARIGGNLALRRIGHLLVILSV
jgi:hypothetical protein